MIYTFPIVATHRDSHTELFYSWEKFLVWAATHDFNSHFVEEYLHHDPFYGYYHCNRVSCTMWVVRDDKGREIDKRDIVWPVRNWAKKYYKAKRRAAELGLPIPGQRNSHPWKLDHTAMKNSGSGHRRRQEVKGKYDMLDLGEEENQRLVTYTGHGWDS